MTPSRHAGAMRVRLTQLDGKLPNLALMKLAHWHKARGDEVHFVRSAARGMFEPPYDRVYASAIFTGTADRVARLRVEFPDAIVGGTWSIDPLTVERVIGAESYEHHDYALAPGFTASIGFTQRGCRLKCKFCVVPAKEGKPRSVNTIADIWRGDPWPRHLHLLDNDFFGQAEWRERAREIVDGKFKVCLNQGINVRLINDEAAAALSDMKFSDDQFKTRRLYTAWDNLKDEAIFFRGVATLERHGIRPSSLLVYMLVGFDPTETWARVMHRFNRMAELGIRPYPMVYGSRAKTLPLGGHNQRIGHRTLGEFQRWVIRKAYNFVPFADYDVNARGRADTRQMEFAA